MIAIPIPMLVICLFILCSCNDEADPGPQIYEYEGSWTSIPGEPTQDVLVFNLKKEADYHLEITDITGASDVKMAVYPPGIPLGGVNLLTFDVQEYNCIWGAAGRDADESVEFTAPLNGSYQITATRDWDHSSEGLEGTYKLLLRSEEPFEVLGLAANDVVSLAFGYTCP